MPRDEKRIRIMGGDRLARLRMQQRLKKRRQRARRYAKGLRADGTTATKAYQPLGEVRDGLRHPRRCPCYDCLWGPKLGEAP